MKSPATLTLRLADLTPSNRALLRSILADAWVVAHDLELKAEVPKAARAHKARRQRISKATLALTDFETELA